MDVGVQTTLGGGGNGDSPEDEDDPDEPTGVVSPQPRKTKEAKRAQHERNDMRSNISERISEMKWGTEREFRLTSNDWRA